MRTKEYLIIIFCLSTSLFILGCVSQSPSANGKVTVVASFYPLYDFAKNIGGDRVSVSTVIPVGVEPHDYEPTPSNIEELSIAKVFIYNGANLEPWVPNLLQGIDNKNLNAVDTSTGIQLVSSQDADAPGNDPHIWLDPVLAKKQVTAIENALIQADPAGKEYYENNTALYLQKLDALDSSFRVTLPTCQKKDILITHATLAYFCKEYGCNQVPVEGVNAEGEPSPAAVAAIIDQARAKNITVVFVENLINPKSAYTIASEINGTVAVFNSLHGLTPDEQKRNEDYISLMQENVQTIKTSLECK